jgi:hypothetical protein
MHDPVYRMSVCSENVAYNQPPEPGIYIGPSMTLPEAKPNIKYYGNVEAKEQSKPFHGPTPINHSLKVFGDRTIILPVQFTGMRKLVSVFDCSGKLMRKAIVKDNEINLQRDFGLPQGMYMVRISKAAMADLGI